MPEQKWPLTGRIDEIVWVDNMGSSGWAEPRTYAEHSMSTCKSIGYLLCEDKDTVTIVQSQDAYCNKLDNSTVILKRCIVTRKMLRKGTR